MNSWGVNRNPGGVNLTSFHNSVDWLEADLAHFAIPLGHLGEYCIFCFLMCPLSSLLLACFLGPFLLRGEGATK